MTNAADILAQFGAEETEWVPAQGRGREAQPSPYLPLVELSVTNGYQAYSIPVTLNGKNDEERKADLNKHINSLRRAGRQHTPPVTVMVQSGDIAKNGAVKLDMKTREKIVKGTSSNGDGKK